MTTESDQTPVETTEEPQKAPSGSPMKGMHAGYTLVASVLLGLGLGYGIDQAAGTQPWWTLGMCALFIVAGLYHVVKDNM